ncbi:MAG: iron transporter [Halorientalis sp.]
MRRRDLLQAGGGLALGALAGCSGLFKTRQQSVRAPPLPDNLPDAVYLPTHTEGMKMAGIESSGGYKCALTYTYPHRFWLVTGTRRKKVSIQSKDSVHLMPIVWDTETGIVPPDINPQVEVTQNGDSVTQLNPWPMLSQPMGLHFGDNVQLPSDGSYTVNVSIGAPSTRRTGSLADNTGKTSFSFDFEYKESTVNSIDYHDIPQNKEGSKAAVDPMKMKKLPSTQVPKPDALPGTVRGTATSGDAPFEVTTIDDATPFGGGESDTYLAVSPRTPYDRYPLPLMSLSGTLTRDGKTVYDDILQSTLDPSIHYHYGAVVPSVKSGDKLTITVDSPPQMARHEGYERAFFKMDDMTLSL